MWYESTPELSRGISSFCGMNISTCTYRFIALFCSLIVSSILAWLAEICWNQMPVLAPAVCSAFKPLLPFDYRTHWYTPLCRHPSYKLWLPLGRNALYPYSLSSVDFSSMPMIILCSSIVYSLSWYHSVQSASSLRGNVDQMYHNQMWPLIVFSLARNIYIRDFSWTAPLFVRFNLICF